MRTIQPLFLVLYVAASLTAQEYRFSHHPFDPALGDIRANTLYFDEEQRIWVGTNKGLLSFDGLRYQTVALTALTSAEENITAVFADSSGTLWLGTENGNILQGIRGDFRECCQEADVPIRSIAGSHGHPIWLGTYGKGVLTAEDSLRFTAENGLLPSDDIYAMVEGVDKRIWVASDAGISVIVPGNPDRRGVIHYGAEEGLVDNIIMSLIRSDDGLIWAGAFEYGFCMISKEGTITYPVPSWGYGAILSMASVDDKELWISTERNGILYFNRRNGNLTRVEIPGNSTPVIASMITDDEGNLWLLDVYRGLYRTNRRFEEYPTALEGIQALLFDYTGQLYAGHQDGLYMLWPEEGHPFRRILSNVNVLSLYEDQERNLWVGTFGQGLYCRPQDANRWFHYTKDNGLTDESILSITGVRNMLWLATLGGVTRVEVEGTPHPIRLRTTNYNLADGLGTNFIYTARADSKGRVWFGTDGKGLSVLENGQIRNYQVADTIPLHTVYSITESTDGSICFVTDRDGIFRFDGSDFTRVELPLDLRDKEINNIIADPLGNVLLAHQGGIDIITPEDAVVRYQESATELLSPNLNAYFQDSTGTIWIAGLRKIIRYNPLSFASRNYPHNVLTSVHVLLSPIDFHQKHEFSATENYLTFNFIGYWYSNPNEVTYRYKVEGLDSDWKQTRERSAIYQRIPPGEYRFVLESSASGQFYAPNQISYGFTIMTPFYQKYWFIALATVFLVAVLYLTFRWNEIRVERAASLKRRQVESQLQTLKAQINPHFLFNSFNTLVSVIEEDPHSAVEYVENLSDFYRSILKYREVNLIPISEELQLLRSYGYLLRKRYGDALQLQIEGPWKEVFVVPLVLQILVENAVKHNVISERRPLTIHVKMHNDNAILVENTLQTRQVAGESTGFGLQNITSRYALLSNRRVEIGQTQQMFFVTIPVIHKDEIPDT